MKKLPAKSLKEGDLTDRILRVFYPVYRELGFGFVESVYQNAMALALQQAGLGALAQPAITVWFRGKQVGLFRPDFIVEERVLIELKTGEGLDASHEAQTLNYLRSTTIEVALLLNFGPVPSFKRLVMDNKNKRGLVRDNPPSASAAGTSS